MVVTPPAPAIDVERIRAWFPALTSDTVFLENAGGSQVPAIVADAIREYMLTTYVQLGAGYGVADRCDEVVERAHALVSRLMNGTESGRVVLGPSCTQLVTMLAGCYAHRLERGDEVIVVESGHEANIGPWRKLADCGVVIRMWTVDPETGAAPLEGLASILSERTKLVAFGHVSNLLGEIVDVAAVTRLAHAAGARVVVDGVAYAPHRAMDVADWNVDWYAFSTYKVYGPHMAALYGREDAVAELTGPNHFFIPRDAVPYKFELGGVNHEGCAGLLALGDYLAALASLADDAPAPTRSGDGAPDRRAVTRAFDLMTACEQPLQARLLEYLGDRPAVRIIGPGSADARTRVGTVSFVHESRSSSEIVAAAHARRIGIRHGHMYAHHLCTALGLDPEDGVVRVSFVHYNTIEEIDRLIDALDTVL